MCTEEDITSDTPYYVVDTRTGKRVYETTYKKRNQARRVQERKNQAHGSYRYVCRIG